MNLKAKNAGEDHIIIDEVVFSRGRRRIFDGISLRVPRGKIVGIMGPSGTGKTTLLRLIGGQLKPESGIVEVDGRRIPQLSRKDLFDVRK